MVHTNPFRVQVNHSDSLMAAGLLTVLGQCREIEIVSDSTLAHVIVADYELGITEALRHDRKGPRVLVVTQVDKERQVRTAMDKGVAGYLMQNCKPSELLFAIENLMLGLVYLSEPVRCFNEVKPAFVDLTGRENDVLQLLATGRCNKEIARDLGIGVGTVKTHIKGVMSKLGATARTHAVVLADKRGLIGTAQPLS